MARDFVATEAVAGLVVVGEGAAAGASKKD
jgi:hypothetical protein